jgi:Ca2+-binding EF-hand superfamily protein
MPDLRSAFARFDRDGSLALEPSEFRGAVKSLGCDLTPLEVSRVLAVVDADHNGFVTYDEFEVKSRRVVRLLELPGARVASYVAVCPP